VSQAARKQRVAAFSTYPLRKVFVEFSARERGGARGSAARAITRRLRVYEAPRDLCGGV
jgi:hypothetical protein